MGSEEDTIAIESGWDDPVVGGQMDGQERFIDPGPSYVRAAPVVPAPEAPVAGPGRRRPLFLPFDDFWPALAILLLAALIGLGVAWYLTQESEQPVPSVVGMPFALAVSQLQDDGFKVDIVDRAGGGKAGLVFEQRPDAGVQAEEGSTVTVLVSTGGAAPGKAKVSVPDVVGSTQADATSRLEAAGLSVRVVDVASSRPAGTVVSQDPAAGSSLAKGAGVRIDVSKGAAAVSLPSLEGLTLASAQARLADLDLTADVIDVPSDKAPGTVVGQQPAAGEQVSEGAAVSLRVSRGPERVSLPSVVGLAQATAQARLGDLGFTTQVTQAYSDQPQGRVVAQRPAAGAEVEKGGTVRLTVSKGPGLVTVPSLVGQRRIDAVAQLTSLGLEANVYLVPSIEPAGTVVAQHPTGGQVQKGSAVRLNVSNGETPP